MITYDINVLIGADDSTKKAHVKCNDSGVNLRVFLKTRQQLSDVRYQDVAYTISENTTAVLRINKPDGHYVLQDGQASADSVFFALHPQAFTSPGMLTAEVSLYDATLRRITSADFFIETTPECISDSSEESKTYIDILAQKIQAINDAVTATAENAKIAKESKTAAEKAAERAEKAKIAAEEAAERAESGGGGGGGEWSGHVDEALSETSKNPVQNMVVTAEFTKVNTTVGNIDALLETI